MIAVQFQQGIKMFTGLPDIAQADISKAYNQTAIINWQYH